MKMLFNVRNAVPALLVAGLLLLPLYSQLSGNIFILTLFTDHKTGVIRVLPYWLHVAVDRLVGITFVAVPFVLGLHGLDAGYYWANGAAVLLVTFALNAPESDNLATRSVHA